MLRLLLDWCRQSASEAHPFFFLPNARWSSEALLRSQFLPRFRSDPLSESWTHADGVIGHFSIGAGRGDLVLDSDARQFVVIEAKLLSPLSRGTKNTPTFDQAARNVACMAENLRHAGRRPQDFERLAFFLVAPQSQIDIGIFGSLLTPDSLRHKVETRIRQYLGAKDGWFDEWFEPTLKAAQVRAISWEGLVPSAGPDYEEFYRKCLDVNRMTFAAGPSQTADAQEIQ